MARPRRQRRGAGSSRAATAPCRPAHTAFCMFWLEHGRRWPVPAPCARNENTARRGGDRQCWRQGQRGRAQSGDEARLLATCYLQQWTSGMGFRRDDPRMAHADSAASEAATISPAACDTTRHKCGGPTLFLPFSSRWHATMRVALLIAIAFLCAPPRSTAVGAPQRPAAASGRLPRWFREAGRRRAVRCWLAGAACRRLPPAGAFCLRHACCPAASPIVCALLRTAGLAHGTCCSSGATAPVAVSVDGACNLTGRLPAVRLRPPNPLMPQLPCPRAADVLAADGCEAAKHNWSADATLRQLIRPGCAGLTCPTADPLLAWRLNVPPSAATYGSLPGWKVSIQVCARLAVSPGRLFQRGGHTPAVARCRPASAACPACRLHVRARTCIGAGVS